MTQLVRPYPVALLTQAREALEAAQAGDVTLLHALFVAARDRLEDLDPDEAREPVLAHPHAGERDKAALNAAIDVADAWEGVVAVGATISALPRFRGFAWACAWSRYLGEDRPPLETFKAWCRGQWLHDLGPEDSVLYAALPALMGLGPEFPDELDTPCPVEGEPVYRLLGLPDEDWDGADPLDGVAISAEVCAAAFPGTSGPWKVVLARGARDGLLVRPG